MADYDVLHHNELHIKAGEKKLKNQQRLAPAPTSDETLGVRLVGYLLSVGWGVCRTHLLVKFGLVIDIQLLALTII